MKLMHKKIIYVDVDGVMSDTLTGIIDGYNRIMGTNRRPEEVYRWHFYRCFGHTEEEGFEILTKIFSKKGFWLNLEPKPDAAEVLRLLNEKYQVYICTAPFPCKNCIPEKIQWLNKYFPFITNEQMIFITAKGLLKGDYMIDDRPSSLRSFSGTGMLFKTHANRYYNAFERTFENWNQIKDFLI